MMQLRLLRVDTREEATTETSHFSCVQREQKECCHAFVAVTDMRFLQSLLALPGIPKPRWATTVDLDLKLLLYLSSTSEYGDGKICGSAYYSTGQLVRSPMCDPKTFYSYSDVSIEQITKKLDGCIATKFQPPQDDEDVHVEIGQGPINYNVVNPQGIRALITVFSDAKSLHAHDNSTITSVFPEHMISPLMLLEENLYWPRLKWCRVERCPEMDIVFSTKYQNYALCFNELETFWASDLLKARCIWKYGKMIFSQFRSLRAIHLHFCPRLTFVLPLSMSDYSSLLNLETLDIVCCGDIRQVFPVEDYEKNRKTTEFPELKNLHLHELTKLQQICEAKMFAPMLETIRIRGCWGLKRLPSTKALRPGGRLVAVDCEKDWWDNLEWDGLKSGHHPSLFAPHHSAYYKKKKQLKGTVLR